MPKNTKQWVVFTFVSQIGKESNESMPYGLGNKMAAAKWLQRDIVTSHGNKGFYIKAQSAHMIISYFE